DQATGGIYLQAARGRPVWVDRAGLERAFGDPDTRAGLQAAIPALSDGPLPDARRPQPLRDDAQLGQLHTLGTWGGSAAA
ncbi:MAG TPA: hypothetical protein VKT00_02730, partial [Casimicrobiaceae bacterium]|nr:hypothetical protein [Casimicrobiaceae bacterium]